MNIALNWVGMISGAALGVAYGLLGWSEAEGDNFDWVHFSTTVLPSCIIGGFAGAQGLPFNVVASGAVGIGLTKVIKKLVKVIARKFGQPKKKKK